MSGTNRAANVDPDIRDRAHKIPKSEWTEMYFDLFRQTHGEDFTDEIIMRDAQRRRKTLKRARS